MIVPVDQVKNTKNVAVEIIVKKAILVTGGAGYIGSHTAWLLNQKGYQVVVLDALFHNQIFNHSWAVFVKGDISDTILLQELCVRYKFEAVMHFAASIEVSESCKNPAQYYRNNVINTQIMLDVCRTYGITNIIFSSSCAVYGSPLTDVLKEDHPKHPMSPYGRTKYIVEMMLEDYAKAYGIQYACLRYFNAAGAHCQEGLYEQHFPETHVIPLLLSAALEHKQFFIFGTDYPTFDGTAIRDYVHVLDIGDAHVKALEYLCSGGVSDVFNLGTGHGFSVLQLFTAVENITQKKIAVTYGLRRQGDPAKLVADATKSQSILGWQPINSSFENIITSALQGYIQKNNSVLQQSLSDCGKVHQI